MRWGSSDVQALTSFLDIVQRKKGEKWVWAWMREGVTASETGEEKRECTADLLWGKKQAII